MPSAGSSNSAADVALSDSDELTQLASHLGQGMVPLLSLSPRQKIKTQRASVPIKSTEDPNPCTQRSQGLNLGSLAPETMWFSLAS